MSNQDKQTDRIVDGVPKSTVEKDGSSGAGVSGGTGKSETHDVNRSKRAILGMDGYIASEPISNRSISKSIVDSEAAKHTEGSKLGSGSVDSERSASGNNLRTRSRDGTIEVPHSKATSETAQPKAFVGMGGMLGGVGSAVKFEDVKRPISDSPENRTPRRQFQSGPDYGRGPARGGARPSSYGPADMAKQASGKQNTGNVEDVGLTEGSSVVRNTSTSPADAPGDVRKRFIGSGLSNSNAFHDSNNRGPHYSADHQRGSTYVRQPGMSEAGSRSTYSPRPAQDAQDVAGGFNTRGNYRNNPVGSSAGSIGRYSRGEGVRGESPVAQGGERREYNQFRSSDRGYSNQGTGRYNNSTPGSPTNEGARPYGAGSEFRRASDMGYQPRRDGQFRSDMGPRRDIEHGRDGGARRDVDPRREPDAPRDIDPRRPIDQPRYNNSQHYTERRDPRYSSDNRGGYNAGYNSGGGYNNRNAPGNSSGGVGGPASVGGYTARPGGQYGPRPYPREGGYQDRGGYNNSERRGSWDSSSGTGGARGDTSTYNRRFDTSARPWSGGAHSEPGYNSDGHDKRRVLDLYRNRAPSENDLLRSNFLRSDDSSRASSSTDVIAGSETIGISAKGYDESRRRVSKKKEWNPTPHIKDETTKQPFRRGRSRGEGGFSVDGESPYGRASNVRRRRLKKKSDVKHLVREVLLPDNISISSLAHRMSEKSRDVLETLRAQGMVDINADTILSVEDATYVIEEMGHRVIRVSDNALEQGILAANILNDGELDLVPRPPVLTIMGHVDHGKTSLLDKIRQSKVAEGEAGGITQHIGAFLVDVGKRIPVDGQPAEGDKTSTSIAMNTKITLIDTPGHEAFSAMRKHGARITDIVVLVVSADDGVMKQTIEAIKHAHDASVPLIVAVNKIDKPGANPRKVLEELIRYDVLTEEFGGEVMAISVSAKTGENIDKLLEAILLQAEVMELQANPNANASGVVVESKMIPSKGASATILVQNGTVRVGDYLVAGQRLCKVRAMYNEHSIALKEALPSYPAEIFGFESVVPSGTRFVAIKDDKDAKELAAYYKQKSKEDDINNRPKPVFSLSSIFGDGGPKVQEIRIILKSDVSGTTDAIKVILSDLKHEEIKLNIISSGVGNVSESDIQSAIASRATVVAFNVKVDPKAALNAKLAGVDIRRYDIIYRIADDLKELMSGLLSPISKEKYLGRAQVKKIFELRKLKRTIAGCQIQDGIIKRGAKCRVIRGDMVIATEEIKSLKREENDYKELHSGQECGILTEKFDDYKEGDAIECFEIVQEKRFVL